MLPDVKTVARLLKNRSAVTNKALPWKRIPQLHKYDNKDAVLGGASLREVSPDQSNATCMCHQNECFEA